MKFCLLCVLLPCLVKDVFTQESLRVSPQGDSQLVPAGEGFALFCNKGQGEGEYTDFKWIGPHGKIELNTSSAINVFESHSGLVLSFEKPTPENSGTYTCHATYGHTSPLKVVVRVTFFHDISFDDCPMKQDLVLGRDGSIRCIVSGNPVPVIVWTKDRLNLEGQDRFTRQGNTIDIRKVKNSDAGRYTVTASVEATGKFKRKPISVNVITPPKIVELRDRSKITEGQHGSILCSATGIPPPLCYWSDFKGRNLSDIAGFKVTPQSCVLEFLKTSRVDEGEYTCHAENPAGRVTKQTLVEVLVPPRIIEFVNHTVNFGDEVVLECRAEGKPGPEMSIRKEGAALPLGKNDEFVFIGENNEGFEKTIKATLKNVMRDRAGIYYCSAENELKRVEQGGRLEVNFPPVLTAKENPVYSWGSRPAVLNCHVDAIPNATIEWRDRDDKLLTNEEMYFVESSLGLSVLTINEIGQDRFSEFICFAKNNQGQARLPIEVREARRPSAPSHPQILRVTATTVTIEFNQPVNDGGMPILEYHIRYWREEVNQDEAEMKSLADLIGKPITIGKLSPRNKYFFKFSARSEVGEGPASNVLQVTTTRESVPDQPAIHNRENFEVHPNRFRLKWTMPLDNGKKIDRFRVTYCPLDGVSPPDCQITGAKKTLDITSWMSEVGTDLLDLKAESFYKVSVEAHNEIGYSQAAEYTFRTGRAAGMIGPYPDEVDTLQARAGSIGMPVIIALAVLLSFVVLVLLDVLCYFRFQWGLLYFLRHLVCSKPHLYSKTNQTQVAA